VTDILPIGYVTILQAVEILQPSMFCGVPDRAAVTRVRQMGMDASDGLARNGAIAEIWDAVDAGIVQAMAIGGRAPQIVKLDSEFTKQIPALRDPLGRGFTLVRPSKPAFQQLADWFGRNFSKAVPIFEEAEIRKLASKLRRTRTRKSNSDGKAKRRGAPSRQDAAQPIIHEVVDSRQWTPSMGMKALTSFVNRRFDGLMPLAKIPSREHSTRSTQTRRTGAMSALDASDAGARQGPSMRPHNGA
jgi:hypothetical protein